MYSRITALAIALTLAATGLVSAQERFGTLQGKVTDEQGAPVPGVTVAVTNLASGEVRTFVTDANGQYTASTVITPASRRPTKSRRRRRAAAQRPRSSRRAASPVPEAIRTRAWHSDELLWDSRGNLGLMGRLATDRPHVAKLYGSYDLPFGTPVGAFFYGGAARRSTPI